MTHKKRIYRSILFFFGLFSAHFSFAEEACSSIKEGYTINYNTVSIIEYIHFASKICNTNFIYNKDELNFTVSVVSDAPITPENVLATLVQVLRIHGLMLLEQDNNLVIHRSPDVKQIGKLVTEKNQEGNSPIVTRIFRIAYAKPDSVAAVIRPMISSEAILETLPETRQLILSDVTVNVDKVASLIEILDSPHAPLQIKSFDVTNGRIETIIDIATQIMTPLTQGNPFLIVPQLLANRVFIVSTPELVDKALEILNDLNIPPQQEEKGQKKISPENVFVYKIEHRSGTDIISSLHSIADNIARSGVPEGDLLETIKTAHFVPQTNSIFFSGSSHSLSKIKEILASLDTPMKSEGSDSTRVGQSNFFIYKPKYQKEEALLNAIREVTDDLKKNKFSEPSFLQALQSLKWIKTNNSFLFTGESDAIKKVEELVVSLDREGVEEKKNLRPNYYIYKLQHTSADVIEEDLDNLVKSFKASGVKDSRLIHAIENIRHVKETNSFLITGDPQIVDEVKQLLTDYDYPRASCKSAQSNFLMYKPQHVSANQMEKSLKEVSTNFKKADLADPNLLTAIESIKYIEATNSLLFTGTPDALQKLQILIKDIDNQGQTTSPIQHLGKISFLLYKIKHANGTQILASIKTMSSDLRKSGAADKEFIGALQSAKYIKETNSILFTGAEEALQRVEAFTAQFDVQGQCPRLGPDDCPVVATNFFAYKPISLTGPDLETITSDFADNLKISGLIDPEFFTAIQSMRWVEQTQSLIFTGTPKALDQIKQLITSFDVPSNIPVGSMPKTSSEPSIQGLDNTNFLVYKLQFHKGDEIQSALRQIAKDLITTQATVNQNLLNCINSIQWIQITNSLLCSGDQDTLARLRDLIKSLDIPLKQVFIEMLVIETNLLNALEFGLEWGGKYKYRNKFQGSLNNITPPPTGGPCAIPEVLNQLNNYTPQDPMPVLTNNIPFNCGFDLGIIGQVIKHNGQTFLSLGSLLSALQTDDETSVILTPKIITQDGKTSSIFVGSNVPFVGSFVNTNGSNTVQTSNIEYRDIGLNLTITPVLGNSDIVTLDISLDRSQTLTDLRGNPNAINFSNTTANGIVTSKTTMETTVHVPDKNFLILSGFVNNSNVKSTSGIPCLGGLPLIGAAFSKDNNTMNNQNIVIFLRPHIINSLEDLRRVTADQEDAFRDQQGTPFLIRQFDEGMELIKSLEDE